MSKTESPEAADLKSVAKEWSTLLDTLIIPRTLTVTDIAGQDHRLLTALPAAHERRVLELLQSAKLPDLRGLAVRMKAAEGQDVREVLGGTLDVVVKVVADEGLHGLIGEAFALAHGHAVAKAIENVKADPLASMYLPDGPVRAEHLFSTADLVLGVVPFAVTALRKLSTAGTSFLRTT